MKHDKNPLFRPTPVVGGTPLKPEEQPVCTKSEQCEGCPYDDNLSAYIDFTKYGQNRMEQEHGDFTDRGYVAYHGTLDLEELLQGDPVESLSPQMKME